MNDNLTRFTLRINRILLGKLTYVSDYEARTKNKEIEQIIKGRIDAFELEHGEIIL